jgi:hypothetical protein
MAKAALYFNRTMKDHPMVRGRKRRTENHKKREGTIDNEQMISFAVVFVVAVAILHLYVTFPRLVI